ncbi:MAG: hypothetical protein DMG93_10110 [Acidobacteria bacterium]|nr:MAG: hypothetical protein DMG93_10110 [Acidobacteriota bacterium]
MKSAGLLLLLMSVAAMGQSNTCPLQPILVKNVASQISVSLQSTSGKQVTAYHLGLTFFDVNGKAHLFPHTFADNVALKSQGKRKAIWHSPQAHQFLQPLAKAYLLDATFSDGTEWLDDGSHLCSVTSVQE